MKLKTLLRTPVITTKEMTPVAEAHAVMLRHGVQYLPVLRGNELVGLLSEIDLDHAAPSSIPAIRRYAWVATMHRVTVADVMSRRPRVLNADTSVADAARLARADGTDAFVVVDGAEMAGVVTRKDLLGVLEHCLPTGLGHILAAISLRSGLDGVIGEAITLAAANGAALTALHVLPLTGRLPSTEGATAKEVGRIEQVRERIAREALATMCSLGHTYTVTCEVGEGAVAPEIARRAAELDSDLIVVNKATPRGWQRLGRRTIADQLVGLAPCPVLAIPRTPRRHLGHASR
jgi:CBS-domain-containing membrane protein